MEMAAQIWTHQGIEISVTSMGDFAAVIDGRRRRFSSVASARKAIDKAHGFEKFKALRDRAYGDPKGDAYFVECEVVGIQKPTGRSSYSKKPKWLLSDGKDVLSVYEDTPENRAALTKLRDAERARVEADARLRAECNLIRDAIKKLHPKQ